MGLFGIGKLYLQSDMEKGLRNGLRNLTGEKKEKLLACKTDESTIRKEFSQGYVEGFNHIATATVSYDDALVFMTDKINYFDALKNNPYAEPHNLGFAFGSFVSFYRRYGVEYLQKVGSGAFGLVHTLMIIVGQKFPSEKFMRCIVVPIVDVMKNTTDAAVITVIRDVLSNYAILRDNNWRTLDD